MAGSNVLAIVVAHASRTRLTETLRSLREQTYADIEVVIAAIGELTVPDDTSATLLQVREGAGFSEAVNGVLKTIRLEGFTYILLLHDDVSLEPDAVERMVASATADPAIAAVGAKLLEWYDPEVMQEVGSAIDRFAIRRSSLDAGEVDAGQRDETSDVLFCSDACLLVRRDAFVEIGGMDQKAWPFYEDVDLCWRLRSAGARVVVEPSARARHAADLSSGRRLFSSLALREHSEHGRLRFMLKHYAPLGLAVLLPQVFVASVARVIGAVLRRELWRVRVIVGAWARLVGELPGILGERRRMPKARVEDRDLLALAARGAVGDVRGERAEWASRLLASVGRVGDRLVSYARQPATWVTAFAVVVVIALLRDVIFGGTFALGELRPLEPFGDAVADHFGSVRREGLDPFGPASAAMILLGLVRSVARSAALAQKIVLLAPVLFAGLAAARVGRALAFGPMARRWLAIVAAVNPVTLSLLHDGAIGPLVMWAASLWLFANMYAPVSFGEGLQARIRFVAQWAFGWAIAVSLHPPAFVWMCALGLVLVVARRERGGASDEHQPTNRTPDRVRILAAGALGAFVLLLPWSIQWFTLRSPLVGRPGWLVHSASTVLERASLGAGWPLLAWIVLAIAAAFFVGLDRTSFAIAVLGGFAIIAGVTGAFARESMLAATGICALLVVAIAARHIVEEMPRYELGLRQAAVITAIIALAGTWIGGLVQTVPDGARTRDIPIVAGVRGEATGRVLWLAETTNGIRAWSTLSFSERLGAFPAPAGPEERLVTKAIESARAGRTHRLGGILALADVSHIVALDDESRRGFGGQADIAPQEEQGTSTVYRNDGWRGPAMLLSAPPSDPLSPSGLAAVVRSPRRFVTSGWPYGPISLDPERTFADDDDDAEPPPPGSVVYIAGGHRGGLRVEGASGRVAAAGSYVPANDIDSRVPVALPGRWWRWMLPIQALLIVALLGAWLTASYIGAPMPGVPTIPPDLLPMRTTPLAVALAPLLVLIGVALGWAGISWGVGTQFLSSAWYCPPIGRDYDQRIGIANPSRARVDYQVRVDLDTPPVVSGRIGGRSRRTLDVASGQGVVVESYGSRVVVGTEVERAGDGDSSLCASQPRSVNTFPEGGRAATLAVPRLFERYILFNPFPDLARASIRFLSPDEPISPPKLRDIQVPPGSVVVIDPEDSFEPMLDLSTTVRVWQGRVIVARRLRTVEQVSWSLPSEEITTGVVPRAGTADGATNIIGANVGADPIRVTLSGAGPTGSLPEASFDIPEEGRADFKLTTIAPRTADVVLSVASEVPIALESLVAPDDRATVSMLPPLQPSRRWVLPIAEDRELLITNPTSKAVRVVLTRLGPGGGIGDVTVPANKVLHVKLRGREPFGVLAEARTGPVVTAVVGPRGSMPGVPLD